MTISRNHKYLKPGAEIALRPNTVYPPSVHDVDWK
jgi:hypothetical protein